MPFENWIFEHKAPRDKRDSGSCERRSALSANMAENRFLQTQEERIFFAINLMPLSYKKTKMQDAKRQMVPFG